MSSRLRQLMDEVVAKFAATPAMREAMFSDFIYWGTPVVAIEAVLLDTPPQPLRRTFTGAEHLTDDEYGPILTAWQRDRIGGRDELQEDCRGKYWHPPANAELYRLQRIEHGFTKFNGWAYYLLVYGGQAIFLEQRVGQDGARLRVVSEASDDAHYFDHALRNALCWHPKAANTD